MNKSRDVETLSDYNVLDHMEAIKSGDFDLYENEYELVKGTLGLPLSFMELDELEQQMILLYNDQDFIEPYSGKKTKNNTFVSFLACYPNKDIVSKLFETIQVEDGHDREGGTLYKNAIIPNSQTHVQRLRLKALASSIWSKSNLKEVAKSMRELVENDGYKDEELLERRIIDDALSSERDSFTLQNRKMSMDMKGMKKPSSLQNINVWIEGGGSKANRVIVEESKNEVYDLMPSKEDGE